MLLLHIYDRRLFECRDDHENGRIDGVDAVEVDGNYAVIDEDQCEGDLDEAGDALGHGDLPAGVVVFSVADGADRAKDCGD